MVFNWLISHNLGAEQRQTNSRPYQVREQITPELRMQLMSQRGMWAWKVAVTVQGPQSQEIDVEPDGASPVGTIMLCVILSMHIAAFAQRPAVPTSNSQ